MTIHADAKPRFDLYRSAHKGLRKALFDATLRVGAADFRDPAMAAMAADTARGLALMSRKHIASEARFVHAVVEQRAPGLMAALDHAHDDHGRDLDRLEALADELQGASRAADRLAAGGRLYETLALFVAADLAHMAQEEQTIMPELWRLFSDEELIGMQQSIVQALAPEVLAMFLRQMLPAMNAPEREKMLGGFKQGLPAEQWAGVWSLAGGVLDAAALAELAAALDPSGALAPTARKLLQIDFPYYGPWAEEMASSLLGLAEEVAATPGLIWKIWTENAQARRTGGIYLFADAASLEAYCRQHLARLARLGISKVEAKVFDVNERLGTVSRAPLAA